MFGNKTFTVINNNQNVVSPWLADFVHKDRHDTLLRDLYKIATLYFNMDATCN